MASIRRTLEIAAPPEAVFDLVADIEALAAFFPQIEQVRRLGPTVWRWRARVAGMALSWEGEIVEAQRPIRLAWVAYRGMANRGHYEFTATARGTRVDFFLHYELPGAVFTELFAQLASPMIDKVASEAMARIKSHLEKPDAQADS